MSAPTSTNQVHARISTTHKVWEVTAFLVVGGGLLAGGGWYCLAYSDTDKLALLPRQINALVVSSVLYTNLAAIGAFGLGSLYSSDPTMLGLYAVLLWNHFAINLLGGAFLLWAMLKGDPSAYANMLNECTVLSENPLVQAFCKRNFEQLQSLVIGTTAAMWIVQLGAAIMCSRFVSLASKAEDESNIYPGPEAAMFWVPQTPQSGYVEVPAQAVPVQAMPVDGEEEEYKTPRTVEFSRFAWI